MKWNKIISKVGEDNIVRLITTNMPKTSGRYLCSCMNYDSRLGMEKSPKFLKEMYYDAEKNYWHDVSNPYAISTTPYAWTMDVPLCDVEDLEYNVGGYLTISKTIDLKKYYMELAQKTNLTNDSKYNVGRKDCLEGNYYTDDAKYFIMCENI